MQLPRHPVPWAGAFFFSCKHVIPPQNPEQPASSVEEDEDSYFDGPYLVFTAAYHLKRGYCCQSGCRHCPYGFDKTGIVPGPPRPDKE